MKAHRQKQLNSKTHFDCACFCFALFRL